MSETVIWFERDTICKPLKTLKEIQLFLFEPPAWRTLCQPLTPHSNRSILNSDLVSEFDSITLEKPINFCHFNPALDSVSPQSDKSLPKVLVCHDMANGYHDDSMVDGTTDNEAYTFYNWAAVDIFCYFSHNLVTIPPVGWINVAHAHGVKVIGTFITEWTEGITFWNKVFASEEETEQLISSLVVIAKTLKFEGWLINIENKILEPEKLLQFVRGLHTTLHKEVPGAVLIWYDSVTKYGHLSWQNALNDMNRPFFDACDGIFTNYSWTETHVADSAREAGARLTDLYIGIDVWGRNFYGGGMFNTHEAVKLVHKYGCSLAIFAPAWTHEAMGEEGDSQDPHSISLGDELPRYQRFLVRDRALWGSLWPYLKTKLPCSLPFKTSFCRGLGKRRRMYGEVLSNSPWYNLRHMQYQPSSAHGSHGYLLSTVEKIREASQIATPDKKGIIKLRQSLLQLNNVHATKNEQGNHEFLEHSIDHENSIQWFEEDKEASKGNLQTEPDQIDHNKINAEKIKEESLKNDGLNNIAAYQPDNEHVPINEHNDIKNIENNIPDVKTEESCDSLENKFLTVKTSSTHPKMVKFKNMFKKLLHLKNNKNKAEAIEEQQEAEVTELSGEKSTSIVPSSGRSMINASVTLTLNVDKTRVTVAYIADERECIHCFFEDSFNGGSCVKVYPSDPVSEHHRTIRLFHTDFYVEKKLVVCMVTKPVAGYTSQWLNMWLYINDKGRERRVKLVGHRQKKGEISDNLQKSLALHYPLDHNGMEFKDLQTYLLVNEPGFYVPIENSFGWHVFYFEVDMKEVTVTSVNLQTEEQNGPILLGHIGFCERSLDGKTYKKLKDASTEVSGD